MESIADRKKAREPDVPQLLKSVLLRTGDILLTYRRNVRHMMPVMKIQKAVLCSLSVIIAALISCASDKENTENESLLIQEQGSFAVGGTVISNPGVFDPYNQTPAGQTFHGDHAYVFYQIPAKARKYPLVMWHGIGQFSKTWETTPDGREGYQNIFLRRRFGVYLIDQPRRGDAGRSTIAGTIEPTPDEQGWFGTFRIGIWPDYFEGVQFARDQETLNQYFRQMVPNIGPIDINLNVEAVSALFTKTGPGILVSHSHSGGMGWLTAIRNPNIKAIVSYEPGSGFVFPEGEVPEPIPSSGGTLVAEPVPMADFLKLTKIPVVIYYGDFIPEKPDPNPVRMAGEHALKCQGCGETVSTNMVAMLQWCICRRSGSGATPISRSQI